MEPTDLTIEILKGIREEAHKTNEQLDELRGGLESVRGELESVRGGIAELRDRQTATEVRLATELVAVANAVRDVRDLLRVDRMLRDRVDDHERRIGAVEGRLG